MSILNNGGQKKKNNILSLQVIYVYLFKLSLNDKVTQAK